MDSNIIPQSITDATALERRFVRLGWYDSIRLNDTACLAGLRRSDFADWVCALIFSYLLRCAENGRKPDVDEFLDAHASYPREALEPELWDVLFVEGCLDSAFDDYGRRVRFEAVRRIEELVRDLCRSALRDGWIQEYDRWRASQLRDTAGGKRRAAGPRPRRSRPKRGGTRRALYV